MQINDFLYSLAPLKKSPGFLHLEQIVHRQNTWGVGHVRLLFYIESDYVSQGALTKEFWLQ